MSSCASLRDAPTKHTDVVQRRSVAAASRSV